MRSPTCLHLRGGNRRRDIEDATYKALPENALVTGNPRAHTVRPYLPASARRERMTGRRGRRPLQYYMFFGIHKPYYS